MDKIKISLPIIVEGKYDKIKLSSFIDGVILTTDGFGIFKDKQKREFIRKGSDTVPLYLFSILKQPNGEVDSIPLQL